MSASACAWMAFAHRCSCKPCANASTTRILSLFLAPLSLFLRLHCSVLAMPHSVVSLASPEDQCKVSDPPDARPLKHSRAGGDFTGALLKCLLNGMAETIRELDPKAVIATIEKEIRCPATNLAALHAHPPNALFPASISAIHPFKRSH